MDMDAVMLATHDFMKEFKPRMEEDNVLKEANHCIELSIQRLTIAHGASVILYFGFQICRIAINTRIPLNLCIVL